MTDHTIYCGNNRRVEDGQRLQGPLVRYEGKEREMSKFCGHRIYVGTTGASVCELSPGHTGDHCQGEFTWPGERQQAQGDVIERMVSAAESKRHSGDTGPTVARERMTAAAKVLLDEALPEPLPAESIRKYNGWDVYAALREFSRDTRSRILPEDKADRLLDDIAAKYFLSRNLIEQIVAAVRAADRK